MMSSAQALKAPHNKALPQARASSYVIPARARVNRKLTIAAGVTGFIAIIAIILTHTGTYEVTLTRLPAQTDVQATAKPQITKQGQQGNTTVNVSRALVRINQTSIDQYSSQQEHDTWSPSACSAASLTEVINAYRHNYKITDILKIESGIRAITPSQGLLYPEGIDQTATEFGFSTQTLHNPTLDQVLTIANSGRPVIVNFPPATWSGGHFLVVLGESTIDGTSYVHLADSSTLNMQYMKRDRFLYYWRGVAKVLTPKTVSTTLATNQYAVAHQSTLTANFINQVLTTYNSPAQGKGQALYDLGLPPK